MCRFAAPRTIVATEDEISDLKSTFDSMETTVWSAAHQ